MPLSFDKPMVYQRAVRFRLGGRGLVRREHGSIPCDFGPRAITRRQTQVSIDPGGQPVKRAAGTLPRGITIELRDRRRLYGDGPSRTRGYASHNYEERKDHGMV